MAKSHYGKWGRWIPPVSLLFSLFAVITAQPPGFLSIACGGKANRTNENNITWVTDSNYIGVGETADIGNATEQADGSYLQTLRFFPKPLKKSCYKLPVTPDVLYLVRLWFAIGNYSVFQNSPSFQFSIETVDMLAVGNVTLKDVDGYLREERILSTTGIVMYVCLIRTSETDDPFISGIELRSLPDGMYAQSKPGTILLNSRWRCDVGGNYSSLRYPQDNFDRIWTTDIVANTNYLNTFERVSAQEPISLNNTKDIPPTAVMQTAWVANSSDTLAFSLKPNKGSKSILMLYFAEIENLNMSESRSFYVKINDEIRSETITLLPNYSAIELSFLFNDSNKSYQTFELVKATNSTHPPIINAFEHLFVADMQAATYSQDADILDVIKERYDIKDWIADPCYLIPWKGIGCNNSNSEIRISELDLSRRNLTGSVPKDIGHLTALINVSLDNNHLMGTLPIFSNLTTLERLYLQNNNLSGSVPEWLSELKNLKELNIENNNFSGVIPGQLLLKDSLKLSYCGNPYLLIDKGECIRQNSKKNKKKLKVVLGITLSGILIITLALIVGIVMYRKKVKTKKEDRGSTQSSRVEKELKHFMYQDYSMITVPNTTKSRAFTLDEMVAATQTFSQEIGRGGFGSVFFGILPEGKDIAVKVLSLFSHQGVQEFLNEVDLLSRINHRNLVSLLGYCNETREVMLVYEHMPGGSLRDRLYGTSVEHSGLNWKRRLKIALDAAQGLEYLHVGSSPKIIHRDIKTANILLDGNMSGKLADFGLSRMTIDGEVTHVTTAVKGTAGYLDPEYYSTQMLTEKSDVYSFGVVLLEIICGRPPIDLKLPVHELNIVRWVTSYLMETGENDEKITEIIDKRLGGSYNMKSISGVIKVAMRCVQSEPSCRPSVSEIVAELREAIKHEDIASTSISKEIGTESEDVLAAPVYSSLEWSKPKDMQWSDNSSNIPKVGR